MLSLVIGTYLKMWFDPSNWLICVEWWMHRSAFIKIVSLETISCALVVCDYSQDHLYFSTCSTTASEVLFSLQTHVCFFPSNNTFTSAMSATWSTAMTYKTSPIHKILGAPYMHSNIVWNVYLNIAFGDSTILFQNYFYCNSIVLLQSLQ